MKPRELDASLDASGLRIAIAVAEYDKEVSDGLVAGAVAYLNDAGCDDVVIGRVGGAFELPYLASTFLDAGWDAVVALGSVVLGDTDHYEHVAHRASEGLMRVMLDNRKPVTFGILTVRDRSHALVRSRSDGDNKGAEAAEAAVTALRAAEAVRR